MARRHIKPGDFFETEDLKQQEAIFSTFYVVKKLRERLPQYGINPDDWWIGAAKALSVYSPFCNVQGKKITSVQWQFLLDEIDEDYHTEHEWVHDKSYTGLGDIPFDWMQSSHIKRAFTKMAQTSISQICVIVEALACDNLDKVKTKFINKTRQQLQAMIAEDYETSGLKTTKSIMMVTLSLTKKAEQEYLEYAAYRSSRMIKVEWTIAPDDIALHLPGVSKVLIKTEKLDNTAENPIHNSFNPVLAKLQEQFNEALRQYLLKNGKLTVNGKVVSNEIVTTLCGTFGLDTNMRVNAKTRNKLNEFFRAYQDILGGQLSDAEAVTHDSIPIRLAGKTIIDNM